MDEKKTQQQNEKFDDEELVEEITGEKPKQVKHDKELADKKLHHAEEQAKRYLADYQNLQRRVAEEKGQWIRQANKDLLLKLLPVLDTLSLAGKHINDKGLDISVDQFHKVLEMEGVKKMKTVGEKFDPKTMEAIGTTKGEKDIVIEETRAGFTLYGIVLRSAQVIVGA